MRAAELTLTPDSGHRLGIGDLTDPAAVGRAIGDGLLSTDFGHALLALAVMVPLAALAWDLRDRRRSRAAAADPRWFWDDLERDARTARHTPEAAEAADPTQPAKAPAPKVAFATAAALVGAIGRHGTATAPQRRRPAARAGSVSWRATHPAA